MTEDDEAVPEIIKEIDLGGEKYQITLTHVGSATKSDMEKECLLIYSDEEQKSEDGA